MSLGLLEGKVALITGSGRGLGRGHALAFAEQGARVVVVDLPVEPGQASPASDTVAEIVKRGGHASVVEGDVSSASDTLRIVQQANDLYGQVDVLVNNAAVTRTSWLWEQTTEDFDNVLRVNLSSQFYLMRAVVPSMRERGYGRIINITSKGALGHPLQAAYAASKAGVIGLSYSAAIELADTGVTVNSFAPAGLTRMASAAIGMSEAELQAVPVRDSPFIVYLASEQSAHITGQLFVHTEGGVSLYRKFAPVTSMTKDDGDSWWTAREVADSFDSAFGGSLVQAGHLTPDKARAYIAKMTTSRQGVEERNA